MSNDQKPIAYDAYEQLADNYAAMIDTKPHNAYYDRPAIVSLWPELDGAKALDAGCGPGAYSELLTDRGASVVACDISDRMLHHARQRLSTQIKIGNAQVVQLDLTQPLTQFEDEEFDLINAPLCMDYIEDWLSVFREFYRVLKPGGSFVFSVGHPMFDAEYFKTQAYFSVEKVEALWKGFGINVMVPSYRRSLEEAINPVVQAGLQIDALLEPKPTEDFKQADSIRYHRLMHRPGFLCMRSTKPTG